MKRRIFIFLIIFLLGSAPALCAIGAGLIANHYGCTLHEGFANPCVVNGVDIGQNLYTFGVLGWFALATIPIAIYCYAIWVVIEIVLFIRRRCKVSHNQSKQSQAS